MRRKHRTGSITPRNGRHLAHLHVRGRLRALGTFDTLAETLDRCGVLLSLDLPGYRKSERGAGQAGSVGAFDQVEWDAVDLDRSSACDGGEPG
jgi:hypothetical protein